MKTLLLQATLLTTVLLTGCAAPSPMFQATWYLQEEVVDTPPKLYIALLNRSGQEKRIDGLVINSPDGFIDKGWKPRDLKGFKVDVPPGGLLVRQIVNFERTSEDGKSILTWPGACLLPTDLVVQLSNNENVHISLKGLLPSVLPHGWQNCPAL